ncbi:EF-hand calcium-binding domain-containing protein 11 isoform X2 [Hyla sarda]|uniref:EF-hand calcium-binding domain-containing protein 11 isoform X2 n=1 Tax=Hyla sarda TaxID=327740 RepID=UPI0024C2B93C|nr:EF-hand calcium-binding domain-containing protein 11 isoform X2 [Hyla sarda]
METRPAGVYGVSEASVVSGVGGGMSGAGPRGVRDSDRRRFLQIEVDTMMSDLVNGNTGGVRADEFVKLMALKRSAQMSFGDHRQIFSVFDTHCRGFLNLDDFKRAFNRVAPHLSEQTVIEAFREVDGDSDGLVCYKDFEYVMNYGEDED